MIAEKPINESSWQKLLSQAITDPLELLKILKLEAAFSADMLNAAKKFSLRVPHGFVERMEKGNLNDPLLKQVLPISEELLPTPGYGADAVGDKLAIKRPGLIQKYHGRVLFTLTSSCAINCRFCFRREFPYADNNPGQAGWQEAIDYIAADASIQEVILSGGDPLMMPDKILAKLSEKLAAIPHLKILRIHTRLPVVLPERITDELIAWLSRSRLQPVLITHINHPNEINDVLAQAISKLRDAKVTLLNQSVLLKDINDKATTLIELSKKLFSMGILPYYLHLLDKVTGSAHFDMPETEAKKLWEAIHHQLPGYLVPRLVREEAGAAAKTIISPQK
jgi:EF-P beta-lysylation protein EpmB